MLALGGGRAPHAWTRSKVEGWFPSPGRGTTSCQLTTMRPRVVANRDGLQRICRGRSPERARGSTSVEEYADEADVELRGSQHLRNFAAGLLSDLSSGALASRPEAFTCCPLRKSGVVSLCHGFIVTDDRAQLVRPVSPRSTAAEVFVCDPWGAGAHSQIWRKMKRDAHPGGRASVSFCEPGFEGEGRVPSPG